LWYWDHQVKWLAIKVDGGWGIQAAESVVGKGMDNGSPMEIALRRDHSRGIDT